MNHGGARKGAGRPKGTGIYKEPTQAVRLPQSLIKSVLRFVENKGNKIPLHGSKVAAGVPSPADDFIESYFDLNEHLIKHPASTFLIKVSGYSMIDAGIHENDFLVVDSKLPAESGKIVIAAVDGQLTVKRLYKKSNKLYLLPENQNFKPIEITAEHHIHILGTVTYVLHAL